MSLRALLNRLAAAWLEAKASAPDEPEIGPWAWHLHY